MLASASRGYKTGPASLEVDLGEGVSGRSETFSREVNGVYWCAPSCRSAARNLLVTAKVRLTGAAFDRRRLFFEYGTVRLSSNSSIYSENLGLSPSCRGNCKKIVLGQGISPDIGG